MYSWVLGNKSPVYCDTSGAFAHAIENIIGEFDSYPSFMRFACVNYIEIVTYVRRICTYFIHQVTYIRENYVARKTNERVLFHFDTEVARKNN
jgi:hypothetical protein